MSENECFICCSKSGKTSQEKLLDNINHKRLNYPLIPLSYAYECECKTMWAHNKCLKNIFKCPTCRKNVIKPNLCVKTNIDNYLFLALIINWIKNGTLDVKKIQTHTVSIMFIVFILNYLNELKYIVITNNYILLCFIFVLLMGTLVLFIIDYITKYWLYDVKTNTFY